VYQLGLGGNGITCYLLSRLYDLIWGRK